MGDVSRSPNAALCESTARRGTVALLLFCTTPRHRRRARPRRLPDAELSDEAQRRLDELVGER